MAFSDLYELLDRQEQGGQEVLNVYHVFRLDSTFDSGDIAEAYEDTFLTPSLALQEVNVSHTVIEVRSLDNPLDFATRVPSPAAGTRAGNPFPQFNALGVQFNRLRTDMKNGQKRFFFGVELDANAAIWITAFLTEAGLVVDNLLNPWERTAFPGVDVCEYAIIKRVCVGEPPPDPCVKYRLPESDAELVSYVPEVAVLRSTVRSQVSRKRLI